MEGLIPQPQLTEPLSHRTVEVFWYWKDEDKPPEKQKFSFEVPSATFDAHEEDYVKKIVAAQVGAQAGITIKEGGVYSFYPMHRFKKLELTIGRIATGITLT